MLHILKKNKTILIICVDQILCGVVSTYFTPRLCEKRGQIRLNDRDGRGS